MKRLFFYFCLLVSSISLSARNAADTLFLKNGSVILCTVEEFVPAGDIKVKTGDGSLFVFPSADVVRLAKTKVPVTVVNSPVQQVGIMSAQGIYLYQNGNRLTINDDIQGIFGEDLAKKYEWSRALNMGAWMCVGAGVGFGVAYFVYNGKQKDFKEGTLEYDDYGCKKDICFWAGIGFDVAGIAMVCIAKNMTKKIAEQYNASHPNVSLSVSPTLVPYMGYNSQFGMAPGLTVAYSF